MVMTWENRGTWEKTLSQCHFYPPQNLTWTDLESIPNIRSERPPTNSLSHGRANLNAGIGLSYIQKFSPHRAVNTLRLCYENQLVNAVQ
jgi:hypothetical protein